MQSELVAEITYLVCTWMYMDVQDVHGKQKEKGHPFQVFLQPPLFKRFHLTEMTSLKTQWLYQRNKVGKTTQKCCMSSTWNIEYLLQRRDL